MDKRCDNNKVGEVVTKCDHQDDTVVPVKNIQSLIFEVRGLQVMLDFHLAKLYGVENRQLKQAVRRNIERFPSDFMFKLTKDEANSLISIGVSQSVIPPGYNIGAGDMFVFTEQGASIKDAGVRTFGIDPIGLDVNVVLEQV